LWFASILITSVVAVVPLVVITVISYYQYEKFFLVEATEPISRVTSVAKQSIEFFLNERKSALQFVIFDNSFEELADEQKLSEILRNMRRSFGDFVDLGLIDSEGNHLSYVGPYDLKGKNYRDQGWFQELLVRNVYVSDVFLGHRNSPHLIIVVKRERENGDYYMLRAAVNTDMINRKIESLGILPSDDAFLVNRQGVLQTSSTRFGPVMGRCPLELPASLEADGKQVAERDLDGEPAIMGYARIENSPFVFVVI
jgi:two-component system NtrC family sensor kinase